MALDYDAAYIYEPSRFLVWRYTKQARATWRLVRRSRHQNIVVMLPPFPLLVVVLASTRGNISVIADLHTGFFLNPKWGWARSLSLRMLRGHTAIVTNARLAEICESSGVRAVVLHDILQRPIAPSESVKPAGGGARPTLLCPLGYANDEPIAELIDAFRRLPEFRFVLTGHAPDWVRNAVSSNVEFSGYLSTDEYWRLVDASDGVLALTKRDLTMQRAGYEALLCAKPQVTSDFDVLRDFYNDAAVYTRTDTESIVAAVRDMVRNAAQLADCSAAVLNLRRAEQQHALEVLMDRQSPATVDGTVPLNQRGGRGA